MKEKNKDKEITIDQLAIMVSNGFNGMMDIFDKKLESLKTELKTDLKTQRRKDIKEGLDKGLEGLYLKVDLLDKRVEILSKNMAPKFEFDLLENRVKKLEARL
ncbi:MAG: hypothetical protein RJB39_672 [Candidatus Parcubacteria bacterium]|jgi:hypothetical protein